MNNVFMIIKTDCDGFYIEYAFSTLELANNKLLQIHEELVEKCKDYDDDYYRLTLGDTCVDFWTYGEGRTTYCIFEKEIDE